MIEKLKDKLRLSHGWNTHRETRSDITELAKHQEEMQKKINEIIEKMEEGR